MNFSHAVHQIAEIHAQIAKGEVYRGFRSLPVALSGICGLLGAWLGARSLPGAASAALVAYWTAIACLGGAIGGSEIAYNYFWREDTFARRRTRRILAQLAPSLAAGAAVTVALPAVSAAAIPFLPGLWALLFGLGVFAARPYLPRAIGWVALFYLTAGAVLLAAAPQDGAPFSLAVGFTFGAGQIATATVLYWNLERRNDDAHDEEAAPA